MTLGELPDRTRGYLELEYSFNAYPKDQAIYALALLTGLTTDEISEWFKRQRQREQARLSIPDRKDANEYGMPREIAGSRLRDPMEPNTWIDCHSVPKYDPFRVQGRILLPSGEKNSAELSRIESEGANGTASKPESNGYTSKIGISTAEATYRTTTKAKDPSDRGIDEGELSLPGVVVFSVSNSREGGEPLRRKRRYTPEERAKVAETRKRGACESCRAKRMKCLHDDVRSARTSPLAVSASRASYHELLPVISPTTSDEQTKVSQLEPIDGSVTDSEPETNRALSAEYNEGIGTTSNCDMKLHEEGSSSKISVQENTCSYCSFKPVGDPKWYKSNIARHMKVAHNGAIQKFRCPYEGCARVYTRSDNLRQHIRHVHIQKQPELPDEEDHRLDIVAQPQQDTNAGTAKLDVGDKIGDTGGSVDAGSSTAIGHENGSDSRDSLRKENVSDGPESRRPSSTARVQDERLAIEALIMTAVNDAQTTEAPI